ncbi:MAG: hypothetical protein HZA93_26285 [Verrucomicrobia bacterium]|nr:hypothetical protein [Verrucomicrobiota bacterium]
MFSACSLVLAGCATPGLLHLYSLANSESDTIADTAPANAADTPSFVQPDETVVGFAYDPFTDHFFLRLAPGDAIRVVDRPARAIKREFTIPQLKAAGPGDLAIRPRDGHVFAAMPGAAKLAEFTRYGEFLREVTLERAAAGGDPNGIAYDSVQNRLLVHRGPTRVVAAHATDGRFIATLTLDRDVAPGALAFDSERSELYIALPGGAALGIFGEDGKLRREVPLRASCFDLGPRSFLRMF